MTTTYTFNIRTTINIFENNEFFDYFNADKFAIAEWIYNISYTKHIF